MSVENPDIDDKESAIELRNILLKDIDPRDIRRAWFTLSHLLLEEGARVIDMGCQDGVLTYTMAAMAPHIRFVGLDKSKRHVSKAKEIYNLHNLEFKIGDLTTDIFEPESHDAIINSFVLHEVYSASRYNERIVSDTLRRQFRVLKKGGAMFIQDYARPPQGEFVLLEMPDIPSNGDDLASLSEPDLLVWYSRHARPRQDPGCAGFFLEELPPRFPRTRLFRLPHKWAYEFIMRKDDRQHWETALPMEFTFFTMPEFRRELRALGMRVQYSGPYWDDEYIEKHIDKNIRLYQDNGTAMGPPASCFIALSYKLSERKSLNFEERRPETSQGGSLKLSAVRDQKTGRISDVVTREIEISEIIPYRVDEDGSLKVYLHDGVAKTISNAVPRSGLNIDERRWSGHMVEQLAVNTSMMMAIDEPDAKNSALFARNVLSLRAEDNAALERGPDYYPSPDYIDERIHTFYLKVAKSKAPVIPRNVLGHDDKFQAKGVLREFDAQQILNAITVGLIPNARLELQILSLYQRLDILAENWTQKKIKLEAGAISGNRALRKHLNQFVNQGKRFRDIKGTAGQLRAVHSTFVEEGQARGTITGLSAQDVDFVIFDDKTINTAVILPLTADARKEVHAGFLLDQLPVPERREGNGLTASAISFNLPPDITNMKLAKKYIADKFSVTPEMVIKMGECYFSHVDVTPQKIYPFAVAMPAKFEKDPGTIYIPLTQIMMMWQSQSRDHKFSLKAGKRPAMVWDTNFAISISRCYKLLHEQYALDAKLDSKAILKERLAYKPPNWSPPLSYRPAPIFKPKAPVPDSPALFAYKPNYSEKPEPVFAALAGRPVEKKSMPEAAAPSAAAEIEMLEKANQAQDQPDIHLDINHSSLPNLLADFEKELEDIFEDLSKDGPSEPKPEKW
jgi:SAM-dependent methyltransferase